MATLTRMLDDVVGRCGGKVALKSMETGKESTFGALRKDAMKVAGALRFGCGVGVGDRVAIMGKGPEFLQGEFGILYSGAAAVLMNEKPRPKGLLAEQLKFTDPKVILTQGAYVERFRNQDSGGRKIIVLEEVLGEEGEIPEVEPGVGDHDLATLIFSSGTSAESARAFNVIGLTHNNVASNISGSAHLLDLVKPGPFMAGLAQQDHSFESMMEKAMLLYAGVPLFFTDVGRFMKNGDGEKANPKCMPMVPSFAKRIMVRIKKDMKKRGDKTYEKFEKAIKNSVEFYRGWLHNGLVNPVKGVKHLIAERVCYRKIRGGLQKIFGNNRLYLVGGSASIDGDVEEFLCAIGVPVSQGFGLTETSPVISVSFPGRKGMRFGSSGRAIPNVDVRIAELGTSSEMPVGDSGEILVRGPSVFGSYFRDPKKTEKSFVDGWFRTGDLGKVDGKGFLYITGRAKRLLVFEGGGKANPEPIEAHYEHADPISRLICVVGKHKKHAVAFAVPTPEIIEQIGDGRRTEDSVLEDALGVLSDSGERFGVILSKAMGNVRLLTDFDEGKYMTRTRKLRFALFEKDYAGLIAGMYGI
jgi:long-chain acyl-CoA synthetase